MQNDKISTEHQKGRRAFLQLAGAFSVGTMGAAFGGLTASNIRTAAAQAMQNDNDATDEVIHDQMNGDAGLDFQILAVAQDFLVQALQQGDVCSICGDEDFLSERFGKAAELWALVQQKLIGDLEDINIQYGDKYRSVDPYSTLVSYSQFKADEAELQVVLADVALPANIQVPEAVKTVFLKFLAVLGIKEIAVPLLQILAEEKLLDELAAAIKAGGKKRFEAIGKVLGKILDFMLTKKFRDKLAKKIGAKAAAKIALKIGAKAVPILGWVILIGSVIYAIASEFI